MNSKSFSPEKFFLSDSAFDLKSEMIGLYYRIFTKIPQQEKFLLFISSKQDEGTTMCAKAFATVSATNLNKSVLLLSTEQCSNFDSTPETNQNDLETWLNSNETFSITNFHKTSSGYFNLPISQRGTTINEVFSSPAIDEFCEQLKTQFDLVILDSPAASTRNNAIDITFKMDGVILIVESENTPVKLVSNVINRIDRVNGKVLGAVFTNRHFYIPEKINRLL